MAFRLSQVFSLALIVWLFVGSLTVALTDTLPADRSVSANDFGGIGLLQNRTARLGTDGSFEAGTTYIEPYRRWYFRLTFLPWFEGVFRYTDVRNQLYSNVVAFSGNQTFKDRGADIKFRLWPESRYIPQIAVGMQDGLGTGLFRGEYLVANKRYYDLDFSFGIGWGYLGKGGTWENPLTSLSNTLRSRSTSSSTGGVPLFGSWFSGEFVAPFYGVEYRTPIKGLTVKAEYNLNDYLTEPNGTALDEGTSPWNFGINYRPFNWLDISLAYERGYSYLSRIALLADFNDPGIPKFDPPPPPIKVREERKKSWSHFNSAENIKNSKAQYQHADTDQEDSSFKQNNYAIEQLFSNLEQAGLTVTHLEFTHEEARVFIADDIEGASVNNAEQLAGLVTDLLPTPVERVVFINSQTETANSSLVISRNDIERNAIVNYLFEGFESAGFHVEALDLTHDAATLTISPMTEATRPSREMEARVAQAVLRSSPTPLESVTINSEANGSIYRQITLYRDEVNRDVAIDGLFDEFEINGITIDSLEIAHEKATVYITAHNVQRASQYLDAAYKMANKAPFELNEISLVDILHNTKDAAVTIIRDESGWNIAATASGASKPEKPLITYRSQDEKTEIANNLFLALDKEEFTADGVKIEGQTAIIYLASNRFRQFARNLGHVARVATGVLPKNIEEFTIISLSAGMEMNRVTVWREDLERAALGLGSLEEIWGRTKIEPPEAGSPPNMIKNPDRYPDFSWSLRPGLQTHIGSSSKLVLYQFWAELRATLEIMPGLSFKGLFGRNIYSNFQRIRVGSDSVLPKVRSDIKEYLQQGESALVMLQGDYVFSPISQVFVRLSSGIFELMYGGISSEVLYRPFNSRLAFGADWNWVKQREFDGKFTFRKYNTGTGHLNIYYELPWYGILTSAHIGQYLAQDRGGTFIVSRKFDSGLRMGAWATLTNVPFEEFGEGSFDKGIFASIPFELLLMKSSKRHGRFGFRPLTRDGGQMVTVTSRLYDITADSSFGRVIDDWGRFLD